MEFLFSIFILQVFERHVIGAQSQAMSFACVATIQGLDGLRINPAVLGLMDKNTVGTSYEYTFGHIEGLQNLLLGFAGPLFYGGLGICFSQFGFSEEREQALTTGYGFGLSKEFYAGLSFDLYLIQNNRTGNCLSYGVNFGMLGMLSKKWFLGLYGHNLNQPQFGNTDEGNLPASLQAGIGYRPFEETISEIDFSIVEENIRIHTAGEFRILDFFSLRTGLKTNPNSLSGGFGVIYKNIKIDYGCEYFVDLPLNHTVSLKFEF